MPSSRDFQVPEQIVMSLPFVQKLIRKNDILKQKNRDLKRKNEALNSVIQHITSNVAVSATANIDCTPIRQVTMRSEGAPVKVEPNLTINVDENVNVNTDIVSSVVPRKLFHNDEVEEVAPPTTNGKNITYVIDEQLDRRTESSDEEEEAA